MTCSWLARALKLVSARVIPSTVIAGLLGLALLLTGSVTVEAKCLYTNPDKPLTLPDLGTKSGDPGPVAMVPPIATPPPQSQPPSVGDGTQAAGFAAILF